METRKAFWEGCRDCLPLMIGAVPVGILCGAMAPAAGFSPAETLVMAVAVFSGAAQFIAISVIMAGPVLPGWIIVGAFLVNAHNLLLGASLAAHMDRLPLRLRLLLRLLRLAASPRYRESSRSQPTGRAYGRCTPPPPPS